MVLGAVVGCPQRVLPLTFVLLAVCSAVASASTVDWHAPRGCPDAASVRARIERRLARSLADVAVRVTVAVTRSRGQYVARLDLGAVTFASDVRTLTSARCSDLADAVAVIVARAASDMLARDEAAAIELHPIVPPKAARSRIAAEEAADDPTVDRGEPGIDDAGGMRRWTIGARLSGVSGIGVIPQVGLGGELAISVRAGSHLAELGAAKWVASAAQFHDGAPAKVDVDLDVTVGRYGWRPAVMPLRAWVAVEVGRMTGHGVRLPTEAPETGRWFAAGGGFGIAWQMTRWARLVGTTEALFALERARFTAGEGMVVYAPAPLSVRFACGLEVGWQ